MLLRPLRSLVTLKRASIRLSSVVSMSSSSPASSPAPSDVRSVSSVAATQESKNSGSQKQVDSTLKAPAIEAFMSKLSARREPSPTRALVPLMRIPGMISLGTGLPNPNCVSMQLAGFSRLASLLVETRHLECNIFHLMICKSSYGFRQFKSCFTLYFILS